jgi:uncharacterized membrane protein YfcA
MYGTFLKSAHSGETGRIIAETGRTGETPVQLQPLSGGKFDGQVAVLLPCSYPSFSTALDKPVMAEIFPSIYIIAALFFMVALCYSSIGLGGGSSYTALMVVAGFSTAVIPMLSLVLNLFVTSIGSYNFIRNKHARLELIAPFLLASMPMAYLGGALQLPKGLFYWVLLVSLLVVALRIYFWRTTAFRLELGRTGKIAVSLLAGAILGLIAGIAGIGGGIYLVPLIIILGLGTEHQAAACGAIFVWLNSLTGLISRLQYNSIDLTPCLPLIVAVVLGGALGSWLGASRLSRHAMEKILGLIVIVAIVMLLRTILLSQP